MFKKMKKEAISPIIASVFLISLVMIVAVTIIFFNKGLLEEITGGVITLQNKNIALTCNDVIFESDYVDGKIYLKNPGNVLIYGMKLRVYSDKSFETQDIRDLTLNWPEEGLKEGGVFSGNLIFKESINKVILIPVLIGITDNGKEKGNFAIKNR